MKFSYPTSSFGYTAGNQFQYGGGTDIGGGYGNQMAGKGVFAQGNGPTAGDVTGWSPTILYMFLLIIAEMIIFGILSRKL